MANTATQNRTGCPDSSRREVARIWPAGDQGDVELLWGRYVTQRFVPHVHDAYSVGVITGGALAYDYRGAVFTAPKGVISIIEPGEVHTGFAAGGDGWTYRNFFVGAGSMRRVAREVGLPPLPTFAEPVIRDPQLAGRFLALHRTLERSTEQLERDSALVDVLADLLTRHAGGRPSEATRRDRPAVRRVRALIHDRSADNLSLGELADVAGYSPYHFLRVFRSEVGLTPHAYLLQVRVERAAELLASGRSPCFAAHDCGFADQSHLTRRFKQVLGVTPGAFSRGHCSPPRPA